MVGSINKTLNLLKHFNKSNFIKYKYRFMSSHGFPDDLPIRLDIGKREVVGYGYNGQEVYIDSVTSPFPAIRFKEDTAEISQLRQKEKGDWKKLTLHEKKELYRASFAQTFSEIEAPTNDWKAILAGTLFCATLGFWYYMWCRMYVYGEAPVTMTDETRLKSQINRMITMRNNPITGIASYYDYDKDEWKK